MLLIQLGGKKFSNFNQILLTYITNEISVAWFNLRLCQALVSANVPWHVLSNLTMKNFLEDISGRKIHHESTMHKNYLTPVYQKTMDEIRKDIGGNYIWCSVDETTDSSSCFIVNVMIGKLDPNVPGKPHLILCKEIETTNNSTIACAVKDDLGILWPGENQDKFLFLTVCAAYMLMAGEVLQSFYPSMLHAWPMVCIVWHRRLKTTFMVSSCQQRGVFC